MNAATLDLRVAEIAAGRRRTRVARYSAYLVILALVLWSVEAIVIADTDWSRILTGSLLAAGAKGADLQLDSAFDEAMAEYLHKRIRAELAAKAQAASPTP